MRAVSIRLRKVHMGPQAPSPNTEEANNKHSHKSGKLQLADATSQEDPQAGDRHLTFAWPVRESGEHH